MINIAIVEDEEIAATTLKEMVERFGVESGEEVNIVHFPDAISFLNNYKPKYDIVLMDIELPHMNGMEAAEKLRELDKVTLLIFVTNMAQFAVKGYAVDALDFIVKPVFYNNIVVKLRRAVSLLRTRQCEKLKIYSPDGVKLIPTTSVKYIEVRDHVIVWHTINGDLTLCGSLSKIERDLPKPNFVRCHNCYIVNLQYIKEVKQTSVVVEGEEEIPISRAKRKEFLLAMAQYF